MFLSDAEFHYDGEVYSIIVNSLLEVITVLLDFLKARFVRVVGQENVREVSKILPRFSPLKRNALRAGLWSDSKYFRTLILDNYLQQCHYSFERDRNKQLWVEVYVIFKVELSVIIDTLIIRDVTKTKSNNCFNSFYIVLKKITADTPW